MLFWLFDSVGPFGNVFNWQTLSDCGVEMEKASLLCTLCAYSGGTLVAPFVITLCDLGEPVFPECCTEDKLDCMTEVCIEAHLESVGGGAGGLLPRASIAGMVWGFLLFCWPWRETSITSGIGGFIIPGQDAEKCSHTHF